MLLSKRVSGIIRLEVAHSSDVFSDFSFGWGVGIPGLWLNDTPKISHFAGCSKMHPSGRDPSLPQSNVMNNAADDKF